MDDNGTDIQVEEMYLIFQQNSLTSKSASWQFQGEHFCNYMDVPPKIVG